MVAVPICNDFSALSGPLKLVHIIGSIYGMPQVKFVS